MVEQDGVKYYSGREIEKLLRRVAELYSGPPLADISDTVDFLGTMMGTLL
jgi:hypothetical protein